jgi:hypothetical protein
VIPLIIGPVIPLVEPLSGPLAVKQCRVLLPDDPRIERLTYEQGYEVNQTGQGILDWLERFIDELYAALAVSIERLEEK